MGVAVIRYKLNPVRFLLIMALLFLPCLPIAADGIVIPGGGYGLPVPWEIAKYKFPLYAAATLIDAETGKKLQVQRRGGLYHADIQTLTKGDTQVLRELYPEGWSWKRRAVVVEIGLEKMAASIHGMPHGAGKISGNDFNGHFCLHFLNSRVHASGAIDVAHQMMVWKAAGQPERPFLEAEPQQVIKLVFTALNQGDAGLASLGISIQTEEDYYLVEQSLLRKLPLVNVNKIAEKEPQEYLLDVEVSYPGEKGKQKKQGVLIVGKDTQAQRWLIKGAELRKLLQGAD